MILIIIIIKKKLLSSSASIILLMILVVVMIIINFEQVVMINNIEIIRITFNITIIATIIMNAEVNMMSDLDFQHHHNNCHDYQL